MTTRPLLWLSLGLLGCTTIAVPRKGMLTDKLRVVCLYDAPKATLGCVTLAEYALGRAYTDKALDAARSP